MLEGMSLPLSLSSPPLPSGEIYYLFFHQVVFDAMDYCIFFSTWRLFSVWCCNILILSMLWSRDELREHLKNAPKMIMAQQRAAASDSDSDSSDDSSGEGGSERANSFDWLFLLSCKSKPHLPWAVDAIFSAVRIMIECPQSTIKLELFCQCLSYSSIHLHFAQRLCNLPC